MLPEHSRLSRLSTQRKRMKHRLVRTAACAVLPAHVATPAYATTGMDQAIHAALAPVSSAVSAVVFYPIPTGSGVGMPFVLL